MKRLFSAVAVNMLNLPLFECILSSSSIGVNELIPEMENKKIIKKLYQDEFSSDCYLNTHYCKVFSWQYFVMKNAYDLFPKGLVSGKRFLEFGAGPTIHLSAVVSKFCESIVTSDFTETNRNAIRLWWKDHPRAFDWTPHLKYCAELEQFANLDDGASEIKERLRNKIEDVLFCDAHLRYPLERSMVEFDVLLTSFCIEDAVGLCEPDDYIDAVKNVSCLLKSKGKLIMAGSINASWYTVKNTTFKCMTINEDLIRHALNLAGFTVEIYKEFQIYDLPKDAADTRRGFFSLSTKN